MKIYITRMYWLIFEFTFLLESLEENYHKDMSSRSSRRRKAKRERERLLEEREYTSPRYEVQPQMVDHWTGRRSLSRKSREDRKVRREQYGTHVGLPIEGPPNWDEIWKEWPDIGTDHKTRFNLTKTLSEKELQIVNRYSYKYKVIEFISEIQSGAFGSVWSVRCKQRMKKKKGEVRRKGGKTKIFACKVIKAITGNIDPKKMTMLEGMKLLVRDINICQGLDHPNIIKYFDVITVPDDKTHFPFSTTFILMQLCQGDLFTAISLFNVLPTPICQQWMKQIGRAVQYLHKLNIVHLDIKPENILVTFPNRNTKFTVYNFTYQLQNITYKLTDFGLARAYMDAELPEISVKAGTKRFMAPEMRTLPKQMPTPVKSKPCDIFSLGASLLYCVVNEGVYKRFQEQNQLDDLIQKVGMDSAFRAKYASGVKSKQLVLLVYNMVITDPNLRLTINEVLNDPFITGQQPTPAQP